MAAWGSVGNQCCRELHLSLFRTLRSLHDKAYPVQIDQSVYCRHIINYCSYTSFIIFWGTSGYFLHLLWEWIKKSTVWHNFKFYSTHDTVILTRCYLVVADPEEIKEETTTHPNWRHWTIILLITWRSCMKMIEIYGREGCLATFKDRRGFIKKNNFLTTFGNFLKQKFPKATKKLPRMPFVSGWFVWNDEVFICRLNCPSWMSFK